MKIKAADQCSLWRPLDQTCQLPAFHFFSANITHIILAKSFANSYDSTLSNHFTTDRKPWNPHCVSVKPTRLLSYFKILRGRIHVFFLSLIFSWQPSWNLSFSHGLWKEQNNLIRSVTVYSLIISIQYLKEKLIIITF